MQGVNAPLSTVSIRPRNSFQREALSFSVMEDALRSLLSAARWHSSSAICVEIPVYVESRSLAGGTCWLAKTASKASRVSVRGSLLLLVSGTKYGLPGRTSLTELTSAEMCLMLSTICSSSFRKIRLLCLPISSMTSVCRHRSPISSRCSTSKRRMRSRPGCVTDRMRPFCRCLRRSMQKAGACKGACLFLEVK